MKKILFFMQLPPPVHGQSVMNGFVYNSNLLNNNFITKTIPLRFTKLENIGKASLTKIILMFKYLFLLICNIVIFRPHIIYFTISPVGFAFLRDVFYVAVMKLFSCKIVLHLHGKGIKNNMQKAFKKKLYNFAFNNTNVILISPLLKDDISDIKASYNLFFLTNCIKLNDSILMSSIKKSNNIPVILFLSNIDPTKGVETLLEAGNILLQKGIKFKMNFVGSFTPAYNHETLNNKIKMLDLDSCAFYLGPQYGDGKNKVLLDSDIFAFPTYYAQETFGLVNLEAMQAGLPVISTYEGAIPDIVDDGITGFLVPQKNPQALAEKLEILIKDSELRQKMGAAGRKKFLEKYTVDKFENNLLAIFKEVIG